MSEIPQTDFMPLLRAASWFSCIRDLTSPNPDYTAYENTQGGWYCTAPEHNAPQPMRLDYGSLGTGRPHYTCGCGNELHFTLGPAEENPMG